MQEECFWKREVKAASFSLERLPSMVDVVVVGGDLAGVAAAYELARAGQSVLLLERGKIGDGVSGRSVGMLSVKWPGGYAALERLRGLSAARRALDATQYAIDEIEEVVGRERIACRFWRTKSLQLASTVTTTAVLRDEMEARRRLGMQTEWLDDAALSDRYPMLAARAGFSLSDQAGVNPFALVVGIATRAKKKGAQIADGVLYVGATSRKDGWLVRTSKGEVLAKQVCVFPDANERSSAVETIFVTRPVELLRGWSRGEILWNAFPLPDYSRWLPDGRMLFGSYRSVRPTGMADADDRRVLLSHLKTLFRQFYRMRFPGIDCVWEKSIGRFPSVRPSLFSPSSGMFVASEGHADAGLACSFLLGQLAARLVLRRPHPYLDLFVEEEKRHLRDRIVNYFPTPLRRVATHAALDRELTRDAKIRSEP